MKIVLESEVEVKLWETLLAAHYKWEKNYGDSIRDQMEWYFFDLFKEETEEIMAKEAASRLQADYEDVFGKTLDQYIDEGLKYYLDQGMIEDEIEELKTDLAEEYKNFTEEYESDKESMPEEIEEEIRRFYYNFFNAPEDLIVEYNGEIIRQPQQ